jgi:glycosyltransferase involved in cell wall biosynthesis
VKIVIDAMTAEFGGIRTYVDRLISAWETSFPDDEVHVAVPAGSTIAAGARRRHELRVRRPSTLGRPLAQTFALHHLLRAVEPDAVLAAMPSTTLRRSPRPLAVVVHDLRHQLRPQQFSLARRALRRVSYGRAYAVADGFVSVSARTQKDLHELHPATRGRPSVVVHHGADHVRAWPTSSRDGAAIAFAHHTNKNPDLIIEAWELLAARGSRLPLMIVGVGVGDREALQVEIDRRGLRDVVTLAPYLDEDEFQRTVSAADMIVFPSDFEGFGLPVVEGMSLGKPVVIGPDPATIEVAGGHAVVMTDWTASALAEAVETAARMDPAATEAARAWGESFTWDRAVRETRTMLQGLAEARP